MQIITNAKCSGVYIGDHCSNPIPDYDADEQDAPLCEQCQEENEREADLWRAELAADR